MSDSQPEPGREITLWWCEHHGLIFESPRIVGTHRCTEDIGLWGDYQACDEVVSGPFVARITDAPDAPAGPPPAPTPEALAEERERLRREVRVPLPYES